MLQRKIARANKERLPRAGQTAERAFGWTAAGRQIVPGLSVPTLLPHPRALPKKGRGDQASTG